METALVGLGAAVGAVTRHAVGSFIDSTTFPWATLIVNTAGSFLLGIVLLGGLDSQIQLAVGVGFCGAFTTFSSFSFQTVTLWERGDRVGAVANAVGNLGFSLLGFGLAGVLVM